MTKGLEELVIVVGTSLCRRTKHDYREVNGHPIGWPAVILVTEGIEPREMIEERYRRDRKFKMANAYLANGSDLTVTNPPGKRRGQYGCYSVQFYHISN